MTESLDRKVERLLQSARLASLSVTQTKLSRNEYLRQTVTSRLCRAYDSIVMCKDRIEKTKAKIIYETFVEMMPNKSLFFDLETLEPVGYSHWKDIQKI